MRKLVLLVAVLAVAAVAYGSTADYDPACVNTGRDREPVGYNPAWGSLIRSFATTGVNQQNCSVATHDGYFISGKWTSFTAFYVYTTAGSFVRSVSASGTSGTRDGSSANHLGSGYFATVNYGSGGLCLWKYGNGGNPASSPTTSWSSISGRGVGYDGTYYYATAGSWTAPIGIYNTSGSRVGTVPSSPWGISPYGHGTPRQGNGFIYVTNQTGRRIHQYTLSSGSLVRSFSVTATTGGLDIGWADGYIYYVNQTTMNRVWVYDGEIYTTVAPTSLGTIKSLYR